MSEHTAGRFRANRHKYVFNDPDCAIDPDVVAEQSRKQMKDEPDQTIVVHHHRASENCDGHSHDAYGASIAQLTV